MWRLRLSSHLLLLKWLFVLLLKRLCCCVPLPLLLLTA